MTLFFWDMVYVNIPLFTYFSHNTLAKHRILGWMLVSPKTLKVFLHCLLVPSITDIIQILGLFFESWWFLSRPPHLVSEPLQPPRSPLGWTVPLHSIRSSVWGSLWSGDSSSPDLVIFCKSFCSWPLYVLFSLLEITIRSPGQFLYFPFSYFPFILFFALRHRRIANFIFQILLWSFHFCCVFSFH